MASGALGLSHQQLNRVLESSCAAPSLLNSQPWAFVLADDRIEVLADPHRRLPYGDPDGRQVRLACGAALFNLRLGLARVGVRSRVWLLPGGPGGPLAVVRNGGFTVLTLRRGELERAIAHRHSNTRPYFATQVPLPHQQVLARAAETEQALLRLVSDPGRLAHLRGWTAAAHQEQLLRPGWTAERVAWTDRPGGNDGISSHTGLFGGGQWGTPRGSTTTDIPVLDDGADSGVHPLVGVLRTEADDARAQIQAGQAVQSVLLAATSLGLSASSLPELIEVPLARSAVHALLSGAGYAQAVLRLGFAGPALPTPRRPIGDTVMPGPVVIARSDQNVRDASNFEVVPRSAQFPRKWRCA